MNILNFNEIIFTEELKLIKSIALTRLKSALLDKRAMFLDLSAEETSIITKRTSSVFKLLISKEPKKIGEWFRAEIELLSPLIDSYPIRQFEELSEYVYERFLEKGDLDFGSEFDLEEVEVIGAIMCQVWKTNNSTNLDFSYFCDYLRLDEATYMMVKKALRAKPNDHEDFCTKLENAMCTGVDLLVTITMAHCETLKWPFKMNWHSVRIEEMELTFEDLAIQSNMLYEESRNILENPTDDAEIKDFQIIGDIIKQTALDLNQKINEANEQINQASEIEFTEMVEEHFITMQERKNTIAEIIPETAKSARDYTDVEIEEMKLQLEDIKEETAILRRPLVSSTSNLTFQQRLELIRGQLCLARNRTKSEYFFPAKICNKQTPTVYTVEFLDGSVASLNKSDIANTLVPLFDPSIGSSLNRFIGMRVVALIEHGNQDRWLSGTVGAAFSSHSDSFLVFFDKNLDRYVNPIFSPESRKAREFIQEIQPQFKTSVECAAWFRHHVDKMKMFPLCEQAFNVHGTEVNRNSVHILKSLAFNHAIKTFLGKYFSQFPDWPLVRMRRPVPGTMPQRINLIDDRTGFIIDVDRSMCLLRFPKIGEPGDDCYTYPCEDKTHRHQDEWIYRGSTRFNTMNLNVNNANLSNRQKSRNKACYAEETVTHTARKSGITTDGAQFGQNAVTKYEMSRLKEKANKFNFIRVKCETAMTDVKYVSHKKCSKECLRGMDKNPYDPYFSVISPLAVPMFCGWRRNIYHLNSKPKARNPKVVVTYTSPCHKNFRTLSEIGVFLKESDSLLTMDLFTLSTTIDPLRAIEVEQSAIIMSDFSQGQELFPIPAVNTLDDEKPPQMKYGARKYPFNEQVNVSTICKDFCSGCSCEDDCSDPAKCECQQLTITMVNRLDRNIRPTQFGYKFRNLQGRTITGVYECNENCSCNRNKCFNRVVQNEIKYPLQLFKTAGCGWGVRTVTDIPQGAFIANYVGALMTDGIAEAKGRDDDQYFADLDLLDVVEMQKIQTESRFGHLNIGASDEEDEEEDQFVPNNDSSSENEEGLPAKRAKKRNSADEGRAKGKNNGRSQDERDEPAFKWADYFGESDDLFVLDAKYKGNIGRFLNHSCDPNVFVQHILVDTHDLRLPWSAFFSTRDILAGEELCWNYQYSIDENRPENLQVVCHCGSRVCIGRLL